MLAITITFAALLIIDIFLVIYRVIGKKKGIIIGIFLFLYLIQDAARYIIS
jgi:asparagine N-glycosylation enzyme membrane subunit Stt3